MLEPVDDAAPEYDYKVGEVCLAAPKPKPVTIPVKVKGTKQTRLAATGVADTHLYLIGLACMVLAAAAARKLARTR